MKKDTSKCFYNDSNKRKKKERALTMKVHELIRTIQIPVCTFLYSKITLCPKIKKETLK